MEAGADIESLQQLVELVQRVTLRGGNSVCTQTSVVAAVVGMSSALLLMTVLEQVLRNEFSVVVASVDVEAVAAAVQQAAVSSLPPVVQSMLTILHQNREQFLFWWQLGQEQGLVQQAEVLEQVADSMVRDSVLKVPQVALFSWEAGSLGIRLH